jgi:D-arabinose 5-phosphate isomerase GutQ
MNEVMDTLKSALDQIKVLNNTVATLTATTNKQLADTSKAMVGRASVPQKEEEVKQPSAREMNPNNEKSSL